MRTVPGSPGREEGRSGSPVPSLTRSERSWMKPRSVSTPTSPAWRASATTFSMFATRAAPRRVGRSEANTRVRSVEGLEQRRDRA